jgi:hypothetical protein
MFPPLYSKTARLNRLKQVVSLLLLPVLLGLALQPFGTARADFGPSIELATGAGPTGDYIHITGDNIHLCGDTGECQVALQVGNFYMLIGGAYADAAGQFGFTGPLPRAGDFFIGTALKQMAVPTGPVTIVVGSLTGETVSAPFTVTDNSEGPFSSTTAFEEIGFRWLHTDSLVADGTVKRSWLWGPKTFWTGFEPYADSPDGWRLVSYYDKARMEVNDYAAESINNPYYVSNGLLVKEMVTGQLQLGDNTFKSHHGDGPVLPAGDLTEANPTPPFAVYAQVLDRNDNSNGATANQYLFSTGEVETVSTYNKYGVTTGHKVAETGHYIASPFWAYLNQSGPVVDLYGQEYLTHNARLFDPLFSATGLPITEPYWTTTLVGGVSKDVLVQLFERRVMTYTPSNSAGFQVEMGNVGLQYFLWRHSAD